MEQTSVVELIPADVRATTYTSNDIDVRALTGMGKLVLSAEAQGSGITNIVKIQSSKLITSQELVGVGDADVALNKSTGGKTKLATKFTQTGARHVKHVDLILKKVGTIASDKILTVTVEADSTGDPSGTPLGTAVTVLANTIDTAYQPVRFTFTTPVAVSDATDYWIVLTSDYTASDSNYIDWQVETVASGGTISRYGGSWAAVTTQSGLFSLKEYNFVDVTGGTFSSVGNTAAFATKSIYMDNVGPVVRAIATIAGGSSTGAFSLTLCAGSK